jgi:hypothetical protein
VGEVCNPKWILTMKEVEALLKNSAVKTRNYIWYLLRAMFRTIKRNNSIPGDSKRKYTSEYTLCKEMEMKTMSVHFT